MNTKITITDANGDKVNRQLALAVLEFGDVQLARVVAVALVEDLGSALLLAMDLGLDEDFEVYNGKKKMLDTIVSAVQTRLLQKKKEMRSDKNVEEQMLNTSLSLSATESFLFFKVCLSFSLDYMY